MTPVHTDVEEPVKVAEQQETPNLNHNNQDLVSAGGDFGLETVPENDLDRESPVERVLGGISKRAYKGVLGGVSEVAGAQGIRQTPSAVS